MNEKKIISGGDKSEIINIMPIQNERLFFISLLIVSGTFLACKAIQSGCSVNMGIGEIHISIDSSQN